MMSFDLGAVGPRRRVGVVLAVAVLLLSLLPGRALAHAQLLSTSPANGTLVAREPSSVSFTFGESVGIEGDAVRVFDHDGRRVDRGGTFHPGGRGPTVAVRLRARLAHGTYTATYRVVSADTHIVTGGFVFSIGARSASGAATLGHLLADDRSGPITDTAFAATRAVQYAAIGIGGGLLAFLTLIWMPALQRAGLGPDVWRAAAARAARRVRTILLLTAAAGGISALVGIGLQGAEARGVDFWRALDGSTMHDVLPTRFGIVWGAGAVAWALVLAAGALTLAPRPTSHLVPRPATLGSTGVVLPPARERWPLLVLALPLVALLGLPTLAGHATVQRPVGLFAPLNVLHVAAMSTWLGGLVGLAVGALTLPDGGDADPGAAPRTLATALSWFSPVALGCVVVLIATGVVQAIIELSAWSQLIDTGYGRAIVVKATAMVVLIVLGARQRRRTIPTALAEAQSGRAVSAGRLLRDTVGAELVVLAVVLAAAGALGGSAPGREHAATMSGMSGMSGMKGMSGMGGPTRIATRLGGARLELSLTPGSVGPNTVDITLTDPRTGRPFTATKQLTLTAALTRQGIGPLNLSIHRSGPGRFTSSGAVLGAPGTWTLVVTDRTSEFDESQRSLAAPIR